MDAIMVLGINKAVPTKILEMMNVEGPSRENVASHLLKMSDEMKMGDEKDGFPIGLRVLSVDDNQICLRVLEAKLIQCRYNVTSTTSAIEALSILRQNKNNFDIIVTDVHMPNMDGFKLLEHVGLEMDLPCVMLSADDDPKSVLKGIEHGACDYLLKPVRVEELKNIWQHVIWKKKACKEPNNSDNKTSEDGKGGSSNRKPHSKKRKEQNDDEEKEDEEATADNESVSKKKPWMVWIQELLHKFMDAIKVLGINKNTEAVPKKIPEMMNVEELPTENGHLQKYMLYIKKLEEKANMIATMGLRDQYLNPGARDSYNKFQVFSSSSIQMQTLQPYQQNTAFNISNSGMLLGNNNVARGLVQVPCPPHMNNPINSHGNRFHQGNILQQMPSTSQKILLIHENNSVNGFQTSTYQTHVNGNISMPLNSNMIHSAGAPNSLPMNSMLSPKVAQANSNMNHVNFTSSNSSVSHPNVSANNNDLAVDPMLMLNVTNDSSNYLNFGSASQSQNRNITFGSQFGGQLLINPSSSHSQRLLVGSNKASMNANGHQDYNNSMPLAQQQCKFEKSSPNPDNPSKNRDGIFLDNSYLQGDLGSSGCSFNELENLIQPEQAFGSPWHSDLKDPFN